MAFIEKAGSGYVVKQGNTGKVIGRFKSKGDATKEMNRVHAKNKPKGANKGRSASKKVGKAAKKRKK